MRLCVVVHYHEISLKGGNRPLFLRRLARNLIEATAGGGVVGVRRLHGRLVLDLRAEADLPFLRQRVATVFGIANFAVVCSVPPTLEAVKAAMLELLDGRRFESFRITARRTFKVFPMTSDAVARELGALVLQRFPTRVDLERPALTVRVDLLPGEALVYVDRDAGPGGLPVGVSGRVVSLLSGGIDSPVAAGRLQKRGCEVEFVHFHSVPYLSDTSQAKARALVDRLVRHQFTARLWLVPFGDIQQDLHRARSGLLHPLRPRAPGDADERRRGRRRREPSRCRPPRRGRSGRRHRRALHVPAGRHRRRARGSGLIRRQARGPAARTRTAPSRTAEGRERSPVTPGRRRGAAARGGRRR